jgi:3'-phosphoadenosine 5'-phosphosulfate sulfotransferase (PAPS reductase)/FAD synthetase
MIVVPVSGGKDSQACLKLALATGDRVVGMFNDTAFEHPLTYAHIDNIRRMYGVEIIAINEGNSVEREVLHWGRFPAMRHRFCTKNLKIRPSKRWYEQYAIDNGPFEVWIGVRKDESAARKKRYIGCVGDELITPNDFMNEYPKRMAKNGIMFRLPIIDWSTADVFEYLAGEENPLYAQGFNRVGCFPCLAAGDDQMTKAFNHDEFGRKQWLKVEILQELTGCTALRSNVVQAPCAICSI